MDDGSSDSGGCHSTPKSPFFAAPTHRLISQAMHVEQEQTCGAVAASRLLLTISTSTDCGRTILRVSVVAASERKPTALTSDSLPFCLFFCAINAATVTFPFIARWQRQRDFSEPQNKNKSDRRLQTLLGARKSSACAVFLTTRNQKPKWRVSGLERNQNCDKLFVESHIKLSMRNAA